MRRKYAVDAVSTLDAHSLGEEGRYFTRRGAMRRMREMNFLRIMANFRDFKYIVTLDGKPLEEDYR